MAAYFCVDEEELLLSVGKFLSDIEKILYEHPQEVVMLLRESFPAYLKSPSNS